MDMAADLVRDSHAVLTVIEIEQWHQRYGRYPDNLTDLPTPVGQSGFRYERRPDGSGYSLFGTSAAGTPQKLAQRSRRDRRLVPTH